MRCGVRFAGSQEAGSLTVAVLMAGCHVFCTTEAYWVLGAMPKPDEVGRRHADGAKTWRRFASRCASG